MYCRFLGADFELSVQMAVINDRYLNTTQITYYHVVC